MGNADFSTVCCGHNATTYITVLAFQPDGNILVSHPPTPHNGGMMHDSCRAEREARTPHGGRPSAFRLYSTHCKHHMRAKLRSFNACSPFHQTLADPALQQLGICQALKSSTNGLAQATASSDGRLLLFDGTAFQPGMRTIVTPMASWQVAPGGTPITDICWLPGGDWLAPTR